ncbi:MAG: GDSL-type esterase/lipase family protein [Cyanobacteria bacterium J06632_22]
MADLLLGMSQLMAQTPNTEWEPTPAVPDAVSQSNREVATANTPRPQITAQAIDSPQFATEPGNKLQRLRSTTPNSDRTAALEDLLATATTSEITIDDLRTGLLSRADAFDFSGVASSEPDVAIALPENPNFDFAGLTDSVPLLPAETAPPRPAVPRPATDTEAPAALPDLTELADKAAEAFNQPAPNFTPAAPSTVRSPDILSYATTPSALAMAEQMLQPVQGPRPGSGSQLYQQRQAALQAGTLYTRLTPDSFYEQWVNGGTHPSYQQWQALLAQEAQAVAKGQGNNALTVVVGDSLSQWLPTDMLPQDRFWLNQGISGDTTQGVLNRLQTFANTRPDTIHVMAGVNDLKNGASEAQVLANLEQIMQQLRQQHPNARIVVHSILPTRLANIPSDRIRALNAQIEQAALQQQVVYLDLHPSFIDDAGQLRYELTTDGLHLSRLGYQVWQIALLSI